MTIKNSVVITNRTVPPIKAMNGINRSADFMNGSNVGKGSSILAETIPSGIAISIVNPRKKSRIADEFDMLTAASASRLGLHINRNAQQNDFVHISLRGQATASFHPRVAVGRHDRAFERRLTEPRKKHAATRRFYFLPEAALRRRCFDRCRRRFVSVRSKDGVSRIGRKKSAG